MLNASSHAIKSHQDNLETLDMGTLCKEHPRLVAERYAPLIWKVIGRMARRLPPYVQAEDLYGVGALGLMDAVDKYNAEKGTDFAAYAEYRIRGAILDELRHRDPMPRVLRAKLKAVDRRIARLRHDIGREPTEMEAATAVGMSLERYQDFRLQVERATSVSYNDELGGYYNTGTTNQSSPTTHPSPISNERDGDAPEAFAKLLRREKLEMIAECIGEYEERDQLIMALHYQEGLNFRQIGEVLGLTESRISQIHKGIIMALRSQLSEVA